MRLLNSKGAQVHGNPEIALQVQITSECWISVSWRELGESLIAKLTKQQAEAIKRTQYLLDYVY